MLAVSVSPVLQSGLVLCTISADGLGWVQYSVKYSVKYEFTVESVQCAVQCAVQDTIRFAYSVQ